MLREILGRATAAWKGKETQEKISNSKVWCEVYLESNSVKPLERLHLPPIFKKYVGNGKAAIFCSYVGVFRLRDEAEAKAKKFRSKAIKAEVIERSLPE